MTVHVDIRPDDAALSDLVALVRAGETVVFRQDGQDVATLNPLAEPSTAKPRPAASVIGAWAHLGPISDAVLDSFLDPDPAFETTKDKGISFDRLMPIRL